MSTCHISETERQFRMGYSLTDRQVLDLYDRYKAATDALLGLPDYGCAFRCLVQDLHAIERIAHARELLPALTTVAKVSKDEREGDYQVFTEMLTRGKFDFWASTEDVAGEFCYKISVNNTEIYFNSDGSLRFVAPGGNN